MKTIPYFKKIEVILHLHTKSLKTNERYVNQQTFRHF